MNIMDEVKNIMYREAQKIMNESVKICPVDTGRLRASRRVAIIEGPGEIKAELSYNTEYALRVHEDLEAYHRPPTQAKFLEMPVRRNIPTIRKNLERKIKEVLDERR